MSQLVSRWPSSHRRQLPLTWFATGERGDHNRLVRHRLYHLMRRKHRFQCQKLLMNGAGVSATCLSLKAQPGELFDKPGGAGPVGTCFGALKGHCSEAQELLKESQRLLRGVRVLRGRSHGLEPTSHPGTWEPQHHNNIDNMSASAAVDGQTISYFHCSRGRPSIACPSPRFTLCRQNLDIQAMQLIR